MTEGFLGQVVLFAGDFAPLGWQFCHGQLLEISQYDQLFAVLSNTYGGNGATTFALPDLRDQGPSGLNYIISVNGVFPGRN